MRQSMFIAMALFGLILASGCSTLGPRTIRSGQRLMAMIDSRQGDRLAVKAGLDELGHAKQVVSMWVEQFVTRVDRAHGNSRK